MRTTNIHRSLQKPLHHIVSSLLSYHHPLYSLRRQSTHSTLYENDVPRVHLFYKCVHLLVVVIVYEGVLTSWKILIFNNNRQQSSVWCTTDARHINFIWGWFFLELSIVDDENDGETKCFWVIYKSLLAGWWRWWWWCAQKLGKLSEIYEIWSAGALQLSGMCNATKYHIHHMVENGV